MATKSKAKIEELYHIPENGKAEMVNDERVRMMPTGGMPGRASGKVLFSLYNHERTVMRLATTWDA